MTVRSGNGSGKTLVAAWAALWFLTTRPGSIVVTTAPTQRQVKDLLWRRIRSAHANSKVPLPGRPQTQQLECGTEWYAVGVATDEEVKFQGPHCLAEDHEILTRRGWLGIDALTVDDLVLSVPLDGDEAEWMPVSAVHRYDFSGELNVYESRTMSFAVTDEHRFPTRLDARWSDWQLRPLSDLATTAAIRARSAWRGLPYEPPTPFAALGWSAEQFAEFLGFWIGDGGLRQHAKTGRFYEVLLYQLKPDGGYQRGLLAGLRSFAGRDYVAFSNRACAEWLAEHVGRYGAERRIPREMLDAPPAVLEAFAEGFWHAEGTFVKGKKRQAYNTNRALMDQVQELLIKLGRPSTLGVNRRESHGRSIKGQLTRRWQECLTLGYTLEPSDRFFSRKNLQRVPYQGRVWCISTPHQTFYTRRKGRVFLSGNSPHGVLLIADEASGLAEWMFAAMEGCMTEQNAKQLLIGNPNVASGTFYESHRTWPARQKFHISAYDTPDHIIRREWIDEKVRDWGLESPLFQVRVLGNFPEEGEGTLIRMSWAEAAQRAELSGVGEPIEIGVDLAAGGGDECALYARQGAKVIASRFWHDHDTMRSAGRIAEMARALKASCLKVDDIGVGKGCFDHLNRLLPGEGVRVEGIGVGEKARDSERFQNLRSELFWALRERFEAGQIDIPRDDDLLADQLTQLKYEYTARGQIKLPPKDELKKDRSVNSRWRSPDRADALALAFAQRGPRWRPVSTAAPVFQPRW